ncbi:arsenate reductase family protein [Alloscardovia theropitheci]|uniref:Arsenate reductase family protein n=1 Tax=Alloscardovia theropitheci TaxID=2496842 RepID=A0A4R0QTG0_9BIFI|nr:ArsC/Spx/MgsR family protein [Alloscardovia theropitheci]TCD54555.1 arsenate reductase family protein [Alloscardovia theropitheci]
MNISLPLTILCHPRCSTCAKALSWLDSHNISYTWKNIIEDNPCAEDLQKWITQSKLPIRRFFNTSGMVYRNNNVKALLDEWSTNLSDDEFLERSCKLLGTDGMMCKRPLVIDNQGNFIAVGFKEPEWDNAFKALIAS